MLFHSLLIQLTIALIITEQIALPNIAFSLWKVWFFSSRSQEQIQTANNMIHNLRIQDNRLNRIVKIVTAQENLFSPLSPCWLSTRIIKAVPFSVLSLSCLVHLIDSLLKSIESTSTILSGSDSCLQFKVFFFCHHNYVANQHDTMSLGSKFSHQQRMKISLLTLSKCLTFELFNQITTRG